MRTLFTLALFATLAFAQSSGVISGTVMTGKKKPVKDALVVAFNVDSGKTYDTSTDAKGVYELKELPLGGYEVSVNADGFTDFDSDEIKVVAGKPTRLDVTLKEDEETQPARQ